MVLWLPRIAALPEHCVPHKYHVLPHTSNTINTMAASSALAELFHYVRHWPWLPALSGLLVTYFVLDALYQVFLSPLRKIPGPWLARVSRLYKVWRVYDGGVHHKDIAAHQKYGSAIRVGPSHVTVSDPAAIPLIFGISSKFLKVITPPSFIKAVPEMTEQGDFYKPFGARYEGTPWDTMFSTRDPFYHRSLKVPVSQKFSMTSIRQFEPMADECAEMFLAAMQELEGQTIDFGSWLQWYAFDVIAAMTFQARFGFMEKRTDVHGMIGAIEKATVYGTVISQVPALHAWLLENDAVLWLVKKLAPNTPNPLVHIIDIAKREIERYESDQKRGARTDFLALLQADINSGKNKMTDRELLNHLSNNLLAGSDTTGISLRSIFYYLMRNPSTYRKLVAEIDEADAKGALSEYVTYAECLQLQYLQAVIKEALRLHPAVQMPLERIVPEGGVTVCKVYLPAGTTVGVNPLVIHHNTDVFGADADKFRPERWIESPEAQLKAMERSFLAFGHGSRTCIGKNISILEMGKLVPQILRHFDVEWASDWKVHTYFFAKQNPQPQLLKPVRPRTCLPMLEPSAKLIFARSAAHDREHATWR
ncbi:hypothetical protein FE257_006707 [Aspergillus nanangensis]|uniref:Cytochrome P450 n=1 Tax=Aspergillus nanangensis TaxID=2582783 RepID=A0AAD4CQS2_ASPNN|nr:hypothetical protein FE257_006707 [Aspergillus nanangensis]